MNPILLEVTSNALLSITEQMGVILTKTAYSTNIKERKDSSVAIFDSTGKLLALAQHIPIHFSSLFSAVREVLNKWPLDQIHEGDVFIANDPYSGGGSHLPDIALVSPVFFDGQLICFVVNLGHHADRTRRGTTIYDEGLRIPAVKLYDKGILVQDVYDLILLNYQLKSEREGDFKAQLITNQFGENKVIEMCEKMGVSSFLDFCNEWLKYGERKIRTAISILPDGKYEFEDYLDSDGFGNTNIKIKVTIKIKNDEIEFDFKGSSPQVDGPYNCVKSALLATVYYSVKALLDHSIPANSGSFDYIKVMAPQGSIVNATEPAATYDRETTTQRIADVIFGAFYQIDPENVVAAGNGAVSFFSFSGLDSRIQKPYVYVETIGGGSGARFNKDGLDGVHVHMTNSSNLPVEALETEYPLQVDSYELVPDSGGAGKYRGGLGIRRTIKISEESRDTTLIASTERTDSKPWGLSGGMPGSNAKFSIFRNGEKINKDSKVHGLVLQSKDIVELITPGAGGYGSPLERDEELVKKDLIEGYISKDAAYKFYGFNS